MRIDEVKPKGSLFRGPRQGRARAEKGEARARGGCWEKRGGQLKEGGRRVEGGKWPCKMEMLCDEISVTKE